DNNSSLPPFLKRLSKDFGNSNSLNYDDFDDDDSSDVFGTMIVKMNRSHNQNPTLTSFASLMRRSHELPYIGQSSQVNPRWKKTR
ncbi:hypothetical protein Ancab_014706, partial [Ancistrocladus abbreviatus]